jgi:2,4-dienoyl-CoA reductase-like NADH-dependent reductase (Old Yellow Enzyme family)
MTRADIEAVCDGFAEGAARAVEAGFDGIEIHGANGYLVYQFIHTSTNHRTDEFGGSAANRVRIARMAAERVRAAIGPNKIISLRLSQDGVDDFGGAWAGGVATAREIGAALKGAPIDLLHWSSFGWKDNRDPSSDVPMATAIAEASGIAMMINGGIAQGQDAEEALTSGGGDYVAVGRPSFANPDWPMMVRAGHPVDLVPFDRRYVIKPPLDYAYTYPADYAAPAWQPPA